MYEKIELNIFDKLIKYLAKISYEIYLIQYPVIFLFQNIKIANSFKIPLIVTITFIISMIINYTLSFKKNKTFSKYLKIILLIILTFLSLIGLYKYITSKDYTNEIKALENELNDNKKMMQEREKRILAKKLEEADSWNNILDDLETSKQKLPDYVKNLKIAGIGDSVMLNAISELYQVFPNGYFDAEINRTEWELNDILHEFENKDLLSDIIVLNLGTNGECNQICKNEFMKTIGDREVFWVNATHPDFESFNPRLNDFANKYQNIHVIDWVSGCKDHTKEYLIYDGTHLTESGSVAYANFIYQNIYDYYLNNLEEQKKEKLMEHEQIEKNKIMFIGNDLLLNTSRYLQKEFTDSEFIIKNDFTSKSLLEYLTNKILKKELSYNIVLVFDKTIQLDYEKMFELLKDYRVYFVMIDDEIINNEKVNVIDFSENFNDYLMIDRVHLEDDGNKKLSELIISSVNLN